LQEIVAAHIEHSFKLFSLLIALVQFVKIQQTSQFYFGHGNFGTHIFNHEGIIRFVEPLLFEELTDKETRVVLRLKGGKLRC
jgi:hypothetical protein